MKILITGCAGFIGFHLSKYLLTKKKLVVYGIDNLNNYYDLELKKNRLSLLKKSKNKFHFYKVDIRDKKKLFSIFSKNNIKPIESLNRKLDPNFHQAMIEIEDDQKEAGTIVQEIQKGFTIKDRLLRPSLVGVSKKTSKDEKNDEK